MQTFTLVRQSETDRSTWGTLFAPSKKWLSEMLERGPKPFLHPRIPAGTYGLRIRPMGESKFDARLKDDVPGYRGIIELADVPGRSNIEIHPANFYWEIEGCLAPGDEVAGDKYSKNFSVVGGKSRPAFARLYAAVIEAIDHGGGAQLLIKDPS